MSHHAPVLSHKDAFFVVGQESCRQVCLFFFSPKLAVTHFRKPGQICCLVPSHKGSLHTGMTFSFSLHRHCRLVCCQAFQSLDGREGRQFCYLFLAESQLGQAAACKCVCIRGCLGNCCQPGVMSVTWQPLLNWPVFLLFLVIMARLIPF